MYTLPPPPPTLWGRLVFPLPTISAGDTDLQAKAKNLAENLIWRFGDRQRRRQIFNFRQINFRHIRTQELRIEILLRNRKSANLNSGNI